MWQIVLFPFLCSCLYLFHMFFHDFIVPGLTNTLLWLSKTGAVGRKMHTLLLSFSHLSFHFISSPEFRAAGVHLVPSLVFYDVVRGWGPWIRAPYPAAAPLITVTVTCVLWPRRSVSRSQQWKQSLSSTLSGPSRSQKKSRASWTPSTSRRQRRGEYVAPYVSVSPTFVVELLGIWWYWYWLIDINALKLLRKWIWFGTLSLVGHMVIK